MHLGPGTPNTQISYRYGVDLYPCPQNNDHKKEIAVVVNSYEKGTGKYRMIPFGSPVPNPFIFTATL